MGNETNNKEKDEINNNDYIMGNETNSNDYVIGNNNNNDNYYIVGNDNNYNEIDNNKYVIRNDNINIIYENEQENCKITHKIQKTSPKSFHYSPVLEKKELINTSSNINIINNNEFNQNYTQTTPITENSTPMSVFKTPDNSNYSWGSIKSLSPKTLFHEYKDEYVNTSPQSVTDVLELKYEKNNNIDLLYENKSIIEEKEETKEVKHHVNVDRHLKYLSKWNKIHIELHKQNDNINYIQSRFNREIIKENNINQSQEKYKIFQQMK